MRRTLPVVAVAVACACVAVPAHGAVSVRITSIRVVDAETRQPAKPPYRRARTYAYVVRYRVAGRPLIRVTRRALIATANGVVMARVRAPATFDEPGLYFATSRIPVGRADPGGPYVLRYRLVVRAGRQVARTDRTLRMTFR